jgi:predicted GTPase
MNEFKVGHDIDSETYKTTYKVNSWKNTSDRLTCIDTPGLSDTKGRDS